MGRRPPLRRLPENYNTGGRFSCAIVGDGTSALRHYACFCAARVYNPVHILAESGQWFPQHPGNGFNPAWLLITVTKNETLATHSPATTCYFASCWLLSQYHWHRWRYLGATLNDRYCLAQIVCKALNDVFAEIYFRHCRKATAPPFIKLL